jgi:ADP-ribose pyrophosphatase YjhB (NUDIX family)
VMANNLVNEYSGVFPPPYIRTIAIALIRRDDQVLMAEGFDSTKETPFYRALGGGVEFGESSWVALVREFQEELSTEIINPKYLGCLENIFECYGNPGHEVVFVYECEFADRSLYEPNEMIFVEGDRKRIAKWVKISELRSGMLRLVPEPFIIYL